MTQINDHQQSRRFEAIEIGAERIDRQMELILASRHFRQAKSLDKFLRYVVAKSLAGEENELKELTIGLEVFHRGADYDPRRDAVVRVQANVLRKRMASYYEEEGANDDFIIEMPKGHYVPRFYFRPGNEPVAGAGAPAAPAGPDLPSALSGAKSAGAAPRVTARSFVATASIFILGLLTAFSFQRWRGAGDMAGKNMNGSPQPAAAVDPVYLPLWGKFLEPGAENLLAYGTPQFFTAGGVYLRDVEINSPQEAGLGSRLKSLRKISHLDFQPTEIYTGVGETHGVYLLTRFFSKAARELRVTRSRMVGWDEMKNSNIIFLSSMRFQTLAKELPYPSDFVIDQASTRAAVINLRPAAGESSTYIGPIGDEYATLTVWPGKLHQRRIIILSGVTTWATLAVAEYVTDPEYLLQFNRHLEQCRMNNGYSRHTPYFQVLLRAEVKDNQPVSISYVTHHDLQIADPTDEPAKRPSEQQVALRQK